MKINVKKMSFSEVEKQRPKKKFVPKKPNKLFRWLLKTLSKNDLKETNFTYKETGMEKLGKNEPCLVLMNHSSFIDLEIASTVLYKRPFNIVCTSDAFVGKKWLLRQLGCIPTRKFATDVKLVKDMKYCVEKIKTSVLMYPEASYTFDGTKTPIPPSIGKCVKLLGVPLVIIRTQGAFLRDPLYNCLQVRNVNVSATVEYVLSKQDIEGLSATEINDVINAKFGFDNFLEQKQNNIKVSEPFRADGLERVLYKCPHCNQEGVTEGKGTAFTCKNCGAKYELTEYGELACVSGEGKFNHVPTWYKWEREEVRKEVSEGKYSFNDEVNVLVLDSNFNLYDVGDGELTQNSDGIKLVLDGGKKEVFVDPSTSYSIYTDFFWYEIGDMISISDSKYQYYCFPKNETGFAAKVRFATEEIYKIKNGK